MENSVCFTGHRPEKLATPFSEQSEKICFIKNQLKIQIQAAIDDGYTYFYSGVARGVDIFASEIVLSLRSKYPFIKHVAVVPYRTQAARWSRDWQLRYDNILDESELCIFLNETYHRGCLLERNRYLINNTQRVIAVYNGESGGTKYTLEFAKKQNKQLCVIALPS